MMSEYPIVLTCDEWVWSPQEENRVPLHFTSRPWLTIRHESVWVGPYEWFYHDVCSISESCRKIWSAVHGVHQIWWYAHGWNPPEEWVPEKEGDT